MTTAKKPTPPVDIIHEDSGPPLTGIQEGILTTRKYNSRRMMHLKSRLSPSKRQNGEKEREPVRAVGLVSATLS
jgi:hypothetical protein